MGFMTARLHTVIKAKEHRDILKFMYIFHFSLKCKADIIIYNNIDGITLSTNAK